MHTRLIAASTLVLAVLVAACSGAASTSAPTAAPTAAPTTAATEAPSAAPSEAASPAASQAASPAAGGPAGVALADSKFGKILTDSQGRTLYLFTADSAGKSACSGDCINNWPAFTSDATPTLGTGLDAEDFGSLARADSGAKQVTFYGLPLYYFAGDTKPGDTNGQGLFGKWFVVSSEGKPIQSAGTGSTY